MARNILKCISTIEEFDLQVYQRLNVGIEIQDFTEPNLTDQKINSLVEEYKKLFRDSNLKRSMHGPFLDLKPASPDLEIRKVSYNKYLRALNIAKELEMDYIIFHSQINPYLNMPMLKDLNNLQAKEFWLNILDDVNGFNGIILIENIFEETPEMLRELIEKIDLPNIKVNLDIGHARLGSVNLEKWIKELKDYIMYVHLHTNDKVYDQHHVPTEVEILALTNLLNKYEIDPTISLEYKSDDVSREVAILRQGN